MEIGFIFPLRQLHWWLGLLAIALTVIILVMRAQETCRRERLTQFAEASLVPRLLVGYDTTVRRPLFWLTVIGFACLAATFAQPHWGRSWREVRKQSHDIVICLDTSESMGASESALTRLERAKQKIGSLLDLAPGDRFGLVAFSGAAALQCPLTLDHGYFKAVLNAMTTDVISLEGTDIAAALREVGTLFEDASGQPVGDRNTRIILLISDGEVVSGEAIDEAKQVTKQASVLVLGIGDPAGTEISLTDPHGRNRAGTRTHWSRLDEETLKGVAYAGEDGGYVLSTSNNSDVEKIHEAIEQMASRTVSSDLRLRLVNRYAWPLGLAIFFFASEGLWLVALPWIRWWRTRGELAALSEEARHG